MISPSLILWTDLGVGLSCTVMAVVVVAVKLARAAAAASRQARVAPYRQSVLAIAADGDEDEGASDVLRGIPDRDWRAVRDVVVAMLGTVRGDTASSLVRLLDARGEFERARSDLRSRLVLRRARAAYLLGLARQRGDVGLLLPLLADRSAEVRVVTTRSLGSIGDPIAATALFEALGPVRGHPGIPGAAAAEALLSFGTGAVPAVLAALSAADATQREVATLVAAEGALSAAAPNLRALLAGDPERGVRIAAARALGAIGGPDDVASLAAFTESARHTELRRAAVQALGELGHPDAAPVLSWLLSDPDVRLAQHSGDALVQLGRPGSGRCCRPGTDPRPGWRPARWRSPACGRHRRWPAWSSPARAASRRPANPAGS